MGTGRWCYLNSLPTHWLEPPEGGGATICYGRHHRAQLGSGGMGGLYRAQHPRLPRRDALLPHDWSADNEYRARFNREADLASTLWHPHIVGVHDGGREDGQLTTGDGSKTKRTPDHV